MHFHTCLSDSPSTNSKQSDGSTTPSRIACTHESKEAATSLPSLAQFLASSWAGMPLAPRHSRQLCTMPSNPTSSPFRNPHFTFQVATVAFASATAGVCTCSWHQSELAFGSIRLSRNWPRFSPGDVLQHRILGVVLGVWVLLWMMANKPSNSSSSPSAFHCMFH